MANVSLIFHCESGDGSNLQVFHNEENTISVLVDDGDNDILPIIFDKSTAIKLAKTLRTEINKIQE